MATACIMCGKQRPGIPVENDFIIDAIRWSKRNLTKDEQKNKLVVCKEDYLKYKKNRDRYRLRQAIYLTLGVLFMLLALAVSFQIATFFVSLGVLLFLYLLSLLNYTPKLHMDNGALTSKNHKHNQ